MYSVPSSNDKLTWHARPDHFRVRLSVFIDQSMSGHDWRDLQDNQWKQFSMGWVLNNTYKLGRCLLWFVLSHKLKLNCSIKCVPEEDLRQETGNAVTESWVHGWLRSDLSFVSPLRCEGQTSRQPHRAEKGVTCDFSNLNWHQPTDHTCLILDEQMRWVDAGQDGPNAIWSDPSGRADQQWLVRLC